MRIFFLGGTRFIGHAAAAHAIAAGHVVAVAHRGKTPSLLPDAEDVLVDRDDPSALARVVAQWKPDAVVDTRAMTRSEAECSALAIKTARARAVVLSSADVYAQFGRLNGLPSASPDRAVLDESAPLSPPFPFRAIGPHEGGPDYDKKDVEAVFRGLPRETGAPAVVLRLPIVYGPRDPKRRFGVLVDALDRGITRIPIVGGAQLALSHVDVADVAQAILLAATSSALAPLAHVFNVGEAVVPTMAERARVIARVMDRPLDLVESDEPLAPEWGLFGRFPCDVILDTTRIRDALGFAELAPLERSMARLVTALRESRATAQLRS